MASKLPSIEQEWESFARMVFGKTPVSNVQVKEMRKAFFAGALSVHCLTMKLGEGEISEDEGMEHLDSINEEMKEFQRDMIAELTETN